MYLNVCVDTNFACTLQFQMLLLSFSLSLHVVPSTSILIRSLQYGTFIGILFVFFKYQLVQYSKCKKLKEDRIEKLQDIKKYRCKIGILDFLLKRA